MASAIDLPNPISFDDLEKHLENERKILIKVNNFSGEDDDYLRSIEDARIVLAFIREIQESLSAFFKEYPSLIVYFNDTYGPYTEFISRENVIDLIFLDDSLFPEKEMFLFGQDGGLVPSFFPLHQAAIAKWIGDVKSKHLASQNTIQNEFNLELKSSDLPCECSLCLGDFRGKLRDFVYSSSLELLEASLENLEKNIDQGIEETAELFQRMQKTLDKNFYKLRYRLRRSSLNKLEGQVKRAIRERFSYPSVIARAHFERNLKPYLLQFLGEEDLSADLLTFDDFSKFLSQLSTNIWRPKKYLEREFKKFVKSIVVLKKKDVSSRILQEYLGEFWTHSNARQIKRKIIYHMGPTNSGKTYHAIEALCLSEKGCYLAPLRLLAGELYDTLNEKGVRTSLLTGEEVIEIENATHYSSTIEMAKLQEVFDCCVIDEIQMIKDPQRGWAWTRALVNIFSPEIHVCGDQSVLNLLQTIVDLCGDELVVKEYSRMTELVVDRRPIVLADLQKSDALIVFSRRNALRYKRDLERLGFKVSIVYGRLSPEVRREQARKFDNGETDIIVSTDAIAMGMNLPIKRIVFSSLAKFINSEEFPITPSEIKQIAGRAGRYKRFPVGHVTCLTRVEDGSEIIADAIEAELEQNRMCMVGPDLDIFNQVNKALADNNLPKLRLSEFLRLFNTMDFKKPFFCVDLREMIELAEMVEDADRNGIMSDAEVFGFACAPVNLGLVEHVQYYMWILTHYSNNDLIKNELINHGSNDIDYLETSIKCVELYQWLSRHFNNKNFYFIENELLNNKNLAIEKLNTLLSEKVVPTCSSCGTKLEENFKFPICDNCFQERRKKGPRREANRPGRGDFRKKTKKRKFQSRGKR